MASNPIQRKQTTAFLLGAVVMLIITGCIIAFLAFQLLNTKKVEEEEQATMKSVVILTQEVKSGDNIDASMLKTVEVDATAVPSDAIAIASLGEKNIAKIALKPGTILSADMLYIDATPTQNDTRKEEYNMIILPTTLEDGEYVDIRLEMPNGLNYIVVSKKQVTIPYIGGSQSPDIIELELNEDEILTLSSAIVEAWQLKGSRIYATRYVEAGIQAAATPTYSMPREVVQLILSNPNVVDQAKNALNARYNNDSRTQINNQIQSQADQLQTNEEAGRDESITKSEESRKKYLDSLVGGVAY